MLIAILVIVVVGWIVIEALGLGLALLATRRQRRKYPDVWYQQIDREASGEGSSSSGGSTSEINRIRRWNRRLH